MLGAGRSRHLPSLNSRLFIASLALAVIVAVVLALASGAVAVYDYRTHSAMFRSILISGTTFERERLLEGELFKLLLRSLAVALALGVPVALALSTLVSRRVLDPLERIANAVRRLAVGSYRERLPPQETRELDWLAEEFNLMAATLERVEAQRVELITTVAHELRTPLSGLLGYAEGLREGVFGPEEAGEAIRREVSRLRRVVNDLSEVSRAESGAVSLRLETFDLAALAVELVGQYRSMVEDGGSSLYLNLDGREFDGIELGGTGSHSTGSGEIESNTPILVRADRDRVAQIVLNLISNALRHAPGTPITLEVRGANREAHWSVSDAGPGIAPEHLPHVFERFYRSDVSPVDGPPGTGVGLTISKALARAMGGRLEVASHAGVGAGVGAGFGSRFTLVLARV